MDEEERHGSNHLAREGIHDGFLGGVFNMHDDGFTKLG
jgi:hypothetical protein